MKIIQSISLLLITAIAVNNALAVEYWTVLEDFDSLEAGSIDMQHLVYEDGQRIELWNNQENSDFRCDSGWATVEDGLGLNDSKCLKIVPRDSYGEFNINFTCLYLGYENRITDRGTIYLQYKASDANDIFMAFNDNLPGYESDVSGGAIGPQDIYQGTINYTAQSALVRMSANQDFRARHDDYYIETDLGLEADKWYEMYIQFDVSNKVTRYYINEQWSSPQVIINPATGGEWFGWRDDSNSYVQNIKWFASAIGLSANYGSVLIDNIAIVHQFSTGPIPPPHIFADFNMDGVVNIFDFLILKANFCTGTRHDQGDADGDGDVDIWDFLVLKSEYGKSY